MGSVIPPNAPFSNGIDPAAFQRHYEAALQDRRLRLKQHFFNAWHFYVGPILISMIPGKLMADWLYPASADASHWLGVVATTAVLVAPGLLHYRWRKHAHKRYQQFYGAALEGCLLER
jgi:hypothetical protein